MRIVLVETDGAGGMIHYAYQMATALAEAGAEVTLITRRTTNWPISPTGSRSHQDPAVAQRGARPDPGGPSPRLWRFAHHKVRRVARAVRFAGAWERLTRFLIRERPDVVQFGTIRFPFQAFFLRRLHRAGLYLTQVCHEFEPRERRLPVIRHLSARRARSVTRVSGRSSCTGPPTATAFCRCSGSIPSAPT